MAVRYVRSTDGSDSDNGTTWALAKATLVGVAGIDTAGDTIWVSDNHAESTAGAVTPAWAGTVASPTYVYCGDDSASPPTALATTATVTTTGNNNITTSSSGDVIHYQGITWVAGSGASGTASIVMVGDIDRQKNCNFHLASTGTSSIIDSQGLSVTLENCGFKFGAAAQKIVTTTSTLTLLNCSLLSGGTSPTDLTNLTNGSNLFVDGLDLSNASAGINLCAGSSSGECSVKFRNCKLPASWSGVLFNGTPDEGTSVEMFNCDSGDTNYRYRKAAQFGTIQEETTLVRTGGASDGTTTYSLKLVTNANAEYPMLTLDTPEMVRWNDTTGSAITVTVEFLHDSATNMQDDEIWLEVQYLGTSGYPLSLFVSDAVADVVTAAADQTDSSETWTTTGMANPNTQKLSVTFTPQEKGFLIATVKCAMASKTVFVDPEISVT